MLVYDREATRLQPGDVIYFWHPTIAITRDCRRVMIMVDHASQRLDDKFFFGFIDAGRFSAMMECIAFLTGFSIKPVKMSGGHPAHQFFESNHLVHDPDIGVRESDVICYDSEEKRVWFLRNQMVVDLGIERLPDFFCFARFLGLLCGFDVRVFHRTESQLQLQFVKP